MIRNFDQLTIQKDPATEVVQSALQKTGEPLPKGRVCYLDPGDVTCLVVSRQPDTNSVLLIGSLSQDGKPSQAGLIYLNQDQNSGQIDIQVETINLRNGPVVVGRVDKKYPDQKGKINLSHAPIGVSRNAFILGLEAGSIGIKNTSTNPITKLSDSDSEHLANQVAGALLSAPKVKSVDTEIHEAQDIPNLLASESQVFQAQYRANEDRAFLPPTIPEILNRNLGITGIAAVFDGHGGSEAAEFAGYQFIATLSDLLSKTTPRSQREIYNLLWQASTRTSDRLRQATDSGTAVALALSLKNGSKICLGVGASEIWQRDQTQLTNEYQSKPTPPTVIAAGLRDASSWGDDSIRLKLEKLGHTEGTATGLDNRPTIITLSGSVILASDGVDSWAYYLGLSESDTINRIKRYGVAQVKNEVRKNYETRLAQMQHVPEPDDLTFITVP